MSRQAWCWLIAAAVGGLVGFAVALLLFALGAGVEPESPDGE